MEAIRIVNHRVSALILLTPKRSLVSYVIVSMLFVTLSTTVCFFCVSDIVLLVCFNENRVHAGFLANSSLADLSKSFHSCLRTI